MNQVSLLGRLTRDPELRYFQQSGTVRVRFTLAVDKQLSRQRRMEYEQQGRPTADFINCVAWGNMAETIAQYVNKGDQFAVVGRIETGSYQNQEGQTIYTTDVNVNSFDFISGNRSSKDGYQRNQGGFQQNQGGFQSNKSYQKNQNDSFEQNEHPSQNQDPNAREEKKTDPSDYLSGFNLEDYGMGDDVLPSDDTDVPF